MSFSSQIYIAAVGISLLGIYVTWPGPDLPENLVEWKRNGKFYEFNNEHVVFYRDDSGDGDEIVLCLHGFPTSSYDYFKIWPQMKRRFSRIVAPDFLGLGFSDKPTRKLFIDKKKENGGVELEHNYTIGEQADIVEALISHLRIDNFHLLSHDYGDTVAQELVARYNGRVALADQKPSYRILTVCLLNGGIFPDTHKPMLSQRMLMKPALEYIIVRLANSWTYGLSLSAVFGPDTKPTGEDLAEWWALARVSDGLNVLGKLLNYIPERHANKDRWTTALQKTTVPIHMVYGRQDPVNPPPFEDIFKQRVPRASIDVLPTIGHYIQWEAPEETTESYFRFLDRVKSRHQ